MEAAGFSETLVVLYWTTGPLIPEDKLRIYIEILLTHVSLVSGYQHIRMYDLSSSNPNPVINYEGVSKNVTGVGFQEEGKWMYTGGEDCSARIWDLR
jgi:WD40 repeat protein